METLLGILVTVLVVSAPPAAVTAILLFAAWRVRGPRLPRSSVTEWRTAAARLGLSEPVSPLSFRAPRVWLCGVVDGYSVDVQTLEPDEQARPADRIGAVRILVHTQCRLPQGLELRQRTRSAWETLNAAGDLLTGDSRFDESVCVWGVEAHTLALMDHSTRRAALALIGEYGGQLTHGTLYCDVRESTADAPTLVARVRWIVQLASRLAAPVDVAARLSANAREDPVPGVRLRNLAVLVKSWAAHPQTEIACRAGLADSDPEVRLQAASALGADGHAVLRALALEATVADAVAAEAAWLAVVRLPVTQGLELLDTLAVQRRHSILVPAIGALKAEHAPGAEGAFLRLLSCDAASVRLAAAQALGTIGSVGAVASLHAAVAAHEFDFELRRTASDAIAAIQSRIKGAEHGQLSLADSDKGRLTLSQPHATAGGVSLTDQAEETPTGRAPERREA